MGTKTVYFLIDEQEGGELQGGTNGLIAGCLKILYGSVANPQYFQYRCERILFEPINHPKNCDEDS